MDPATGDGQPTPRASRPGRRHPGQLARLRTPDSYGLVLALIVLSLLVDAVAPASPWVSLLAYLLRGGLLLLVLATSQAQPRVIRWAAVAVVVAFVAAIADQALGTAAVTFGLEAALVALALIAIARRIERYRQVDQRTILAALCVYLLFAMLAASLFLTLDTVTEEGFFVQDAGTRMDFLYFSFVTLTTLGYGDLTPAGDLARMMAVVEALIGQLYLVTVVALIVGNLGQERRHGHRGVGADQTETADPTRRDGES